MRRLILLAVLGLVPHTAASCPELSFGQILAEAITGLGAHAPVTPLIASAWGDSSAVSRSIGWGGGRRQIGGLPKSPIRRTLIALRYRYDADDILEHLALSYGSTELFDAELGVATSSMLRLDVPGA